MFFSLFFKMFWCMTSTTQMAFTTIMITYILILFIIIFTFFFSLFHIIVPFFFIKCVFQISFMTMSIIIITTTKIEIKCCCIHLWEWSRTNWTGFMIFFLSKTHCFCSATRRHQINLEHLWNPFLQYCC